MKPTVERARTREACDLCGRRGTKDNRVFSLFGKTWIKLHARCLAWASLTSMAIDAERKAEGDATEQAQV